MHSHGYSGHRRCHRLPSIVAPAHSLRIEIAMRLSIQGFRISTLRIDGLPVQKPGFLADSRLAKAHPRGMPGLPVEMVETTMATAESRLFEIPTQPGVLVSVLTMDPARARDRHLNH